MALKMGSRKQLGGVEDEDTSITQADGVAPGTGAIPVIDPEVVDENDETPKKQTLLGRLGLDRWQRHKEEQKLAGRFEAYPHLMAVKPKERMLFHSDYFEVDSSVACVLAYFHEDAADDNLPAFWGINRIPDGLDDSVTAVVLEQVHKRDEKWVDGHVKSSEKLDNLDAKEQSTSGSMSSQRKAAKASGDLASTIADIQNGAAYLHVHNRLFLKAPDLETLDDSIEKLRRLYVDRFDKNLHAEPYPGEQRQELSTLWSNNEAKRGKGFGFSSTELAGSYSLVTNGLNDRGGEYVGFMVGDVNNSAVLMDVNAYKQRVVIGDTTVNENLGRQHVSDMWCSKLSQSAMLNNGRVVHLILDGADLDRLGPTFTRLTSRVDLNNGDVNPFELFGDENDEMAVYSSHIEKLKLMFQQMQDEGDDGSTKTIIKGTLEDILTDFYIEQGMWAHNAKENRHRLRVVGIPHDQVPLLQMFQTYVATRREKVLNSDKQDPDELRAINVISKIASSMITTNGDLFNNVTDSAIDGVRDARRTIYDFSRLKSRGMGVAMAQLVNIVGFAVGELGKGDSVIIHGTENIDDRVKSYLTSQFNRLHERGGRVVFSYNNIDTLIGDVDFNQFDAADYTLLGGMRDKSVELYEKQLGKKIPNDLQALIKQRDSGNTYLRRNLTNVVFHTDLALGVNPAREAQRRQMELEARKLEESTQLQSTFEGTAQAGANATAKVAAQNEDRGRRSGLEKKKPKKLSQKDTKADKGRTVQRKAARR